MEPLTLEFPEHISHTQLSMFRLCPQKWFWAYCLKMRRHMNRGIDLRAGGAFAKGLEVTRKAFFDEGQEAEAAIALGAEALLAEYGEDDFPEHKKNRTATLGALYAYFNHWRLGEDYLTPARFGAAGSGVEFRFSIPLPINHPTLDQPLLLEGRCDMIATHKDIAGLWIVDEKTAGSLGAGWRRKWILDAQPTTYVWAAQQHGYAVAGALIRGISFLKRDYGVEEAGPLMRSKAQIDDWYDQTIHDVHRMIVTFRLAQADIGDVPRRRPDRALDKDVCSAYSGCAFIEACCASNPMPFLEAMTLPKDLKAEGSITDLLESF